MYMNNVWGMTVAVGLGGRLDGGGQKGEKFDSSNRITIKNSLYSTQPKINILISKGMSYVSTISEGLF